MGIEYDRLGRDESAMQYHNDALAIKRKIGDKKGEAGVLNTLAVASTVRHRDLEKSVEYLQQALDIYRSLQDRFNMGMVQGNLALTYGLLGKTDLLQKYLQESMHCAHEIGDKYGEAWISSFIAFYRTADTQSQLSLIHI